MLCILRAWRKFNIIVQDGVHFSVITFYIYKLKVTCRKKSKISPCSLKSLYMTNNGHSRDQFIKSRTSEVTNGPMVNLRIFSLPFEIDAKLVIITKEEICLD